MLSVCLRSWLTWLLLDISLFVGGGGVESQREERDPLIWGCWRIAVLIDCWSYPGFRDVKEKWTVLAFYPGSFGSHMTCRSARGAALHAQQSLQRSPWREQELQSAWDVIVCDSFNQELVLVAVLGLHKSWHIAGTWHLCGFRFIWVHVGGGSNRKSKGSSSADVRTQSPAPREEVAGPAGTGRGNGPNPFVSSQTNAWHPDNV